MMKWVAKLIAQHQSQSWKSHCRKFKGEKSLLQLCSWQGKVASKNKGNDLLKVLKLSNSVTLIHSGHFLSLDFCYLSIHEPYISFYLTQEIMLMITCNSLPGIIFVLEWHSFGEMLAPMIWSLELTHWRLWVHLNPGPQPSHGRLFIRV